MGSISRSTLYSTYDCALPLPLHATINIHKDEISSLVHIFFIIQLLARVNNKGREYRTAIMCAESNVIIRE